eukprot:CAMPEP_0182428052 /NCGR_PEP_ID=MMETSP1167-20130531/20984_1 /TAXON_ID=2988 /ORGANISM="Mallomonas Sp, Strain CCMP3275" /LENGTH=334 /DNA_ID=CAMNT_0024610697 /DNA_START=104 /DNA_END=1108 /DNA_ORIENTATION=-
MQMLQRFNIKAGVQKQFSTLAGKSFISISALTHNELNDLIEQSMIMKKAWATDAVKARSIMPLHGQTMSMIFQKRSTRTRVSSESGFYMLGGHALMLGPQDVQLGVNESLKDTTRVLSRFNNIILARVFSHSDILELQRESSVPIINALSDKYHPLQTLADLMTLKEHFGELKGKSLAWVGDGNNVIHDLMIGALKQGMSVRVATPVGYNCDADVVEDAKALSKEFGTELLFTSDPKQAVTGTDVVVTDTWVSMGQEEEKASRLAAFSGYQVTRSMMELASPSAVFLHCLPRKPEEVDDEVFYSTQSLVFPEAENRMWTLMSVAMALLGKQWKN